MSILSDNDSLVLFSTHNLHFRAAAELVIEREGLAGLFGRGLRTRLLANGVQGLMFSVLWKYFQELLKQ